MCGKLLGKTALKIGTYRRGAITRNACPNCSVSFSSEMPKSARGASTHDPL
jgi:hypothetical protein